MKSIHEHRMSVLQRRKTTEYRATFALTCISMIPRSFIHCGAKQTAKYVYPELNATQLVPRSFIHMPYNLFVVLLSIAEPNEKVFWTLGRKVTGI